MTSVAIYILINGTQELPFHIRISTNVFLIYFMYVFCIHICMFTICVPHDHRGQSRASNPLWLRLQMVVSPHVGPEH